MEWMEMLEMRIMTILQNCSCRRYFTWTYILLWENTHTGRFHKSFYSKMYCFFLWAEKAHYSLTAIKFHNFSLFYFIQKRDDIPFILIFLPKACICLDHSFDHSCWQCVVFGFSHFTLIGGNMKYIMSNRFLFFWI